MKKILIVLLVVCMILGLVACGRPMEEQIAEKMVEEMVKEIGDTNDIAVDTSDEGKITIGEGEDQLVFEGSESGMPWPKDKLSANVPELKGAIVVSVASTGEGVLIGFEECDKDEAIAYKEQIGKAGWNILMDMSEDDGGMVMADNKSGESLMFVWNIEDQAGAITYGSAQ